MSLCILTDPTALLPSATTGEGKPLRALPARLDETGLALPEESEYIQLFNMLEREFGAILILTGSLDGAPLAEVARLAAQSHGGPSKIEILETLQIGPGLGVLAQLAARKAAGGATLVDVQESTRALLPYLFTVLCPDSLPQYQGMTRKINAANLLEPAGSLMVYSVEEGELAAYKKVRTPRHLLEAFQEFLEEFEAPQQLVYFHGSNPRLHIRPLREAIEAFFPLTQFVDLELNEALERLYGEHTVGLTVLEAPHARG